MQWADLAGWRCTNSKAIDGGCAEWTLRPRTAPDSNCNCRRIAWPVHLMALLYSIHQYSTGQHTQSSFFIYLFIFLFIVYLKKNSKCVKISFFLKKRIIEVVKRQQGNLFPITSPLIDGDWKCSLLLAAEGAKKKGFLLYAPNSITRKIDPLFKSNDIPRRFYVAPVYVCVCECI